MHQNIEIMNVVLIEERAYEQMKHRIRELTELVGNLSEKILNPGSGE